MRAYLLRLHKLAGDVLRLTKGEQDGVVCSDTAFRPCSFTELSLLILIF